MAIDFTAQTPPQPFLIGNLLVLQYDENGQLGSFFAALYPFKATRGHVEADIRGQGSLALIGHLVFDRTKRGAKRLGATMTVEGKRSRLVFKFKSPKDVIKSTPPPDAKPLGEPSTTERPADTDRSGGTGLYASVVRAARELTGGR